MKMKRLGGVLLVALIAFQQARGADYLHAWREGDKTAIQVEGNDDDDWYIQRSSDLRTWSNITSIGTLLSGRANAPYRLIDSGPGPEFYRAVKTDGLYDTNLFRRISLTFSNASWQTDLTLARSRETDVPAVLEMDNGARLPIIGARYKGNTSFTSAGSKKSINLSIDYADDRARLMGFKTVNLNNAAGDATLMREPLYFNIMRRYVPCPRGSMAQVYINGANRGVYALIEQENSDLINEYFPSNDGDRWRAPNIGRAPGPGGGGGFEAGGSAFTYLGTNLATYRQNYELKTDNSTNAWQRLTNAIILLNTIPADEFRERIEEVFAVDSWLWYLALENVLTDDDSYWNKGADYGFYYEPESGRIHPVQHDGNEAFTFRDTNLSPLTGAAPNRPLLFKFLGNPELRQRYLAHIRTILAESFNPGQVTPMIDHFHKLSVSAIVEDPFKVYTMTAYTNELRLLRMWVTNRHRFLTNHAEVRAFGPSIEQVTGPASPPQPSEAAIITASVKPSGTNGIDSVWLYWRDRSYGKFSRTPMFDDGAHGDGSAGDGMFGATIEGFPAGRRIHYYVEARSGNATRTASFSPPRAEIEPFSYRVAVVSASYSPVVINEIMAQNTAAVRDPQGDFDDWIELRNVTSQVVDISGWHLSDEPNNPRKWRFPPGTTIPPDGYLLVWADEDGRDTPGLHASFKLSAGGEAVFLTDTDANQNAVRDSLTFGPQETDQSFGRSPNDSNQFVVMDPTPGAANK